MAFGSLLVLLDDIAAVLDDVSVMTKVAAKKTAGVLGDDLAVNAEKVTGVRPERELPVVWAVAKGSLINKCILVPAALAISAVVPWLILPLLVCGGLYLCFEGAEKLLHAGEGKHSEAEAEAHLAVLAATPAGSGADERAKIRGAVRTDFILSAEIIVLTLGIVEGSDLVTQLGVLTGISLVMTVGVYGLVAAIVKLDDLGLYLSGRRGEQLRQRLARWFGLRLLDFAPWLMKALGVVGTVAMFMVGGGILLHAWHAGEHWVMTNAGMLGPVAGLAPVLAGALLGLVAGVVIAKGLALTGLAGKHD